MKVLSNVDFCRYLRQHPTGAIAGLDFGAKQIGLSVSDPSRHFVHPLGSINRTRRGVNRSVGVEILSKMGQLFRDKGHKDITAVVIGLPVFDGQLTPFCREISSTVTLLEKLCTEQQQQQVSMSQAVSIEHIKNATMTDSKQRRADGLEQYEEQNQTVSCDGMNISSDDADSGDYCDDGHPQSQLQQSQMQQRQKLQQSVAPYVPATVPSEIFRYIPPVCTFWDEYNTTSDAKAALAEMTGKRAVRMRQKDAIAASIILERFLEDRRNLKQGIRAPPPGYGTTSNFTSSRRSKSTSPIDSTGANNSNDSSASASAGITSGRLGRRRR